MGELKQIETKDEGEVSLVTHCLEPILLRYKTMSPGYLSLPSTGLLRPQVDRSLVWVASTCAQTPIFFLEGPIVA